MSTEETFRRLEYNYRGPLQLQTHTLSELTSNLKSTEIIVKIKAASLNPVDIILYKLHGYLFFKRGPKGLGRDFSGIITQVGSDVKADKFQIGDEISGIFEPIFSDQGSVTEYLKLDIDSNKSIGKIPKNLTIQEASSFPLVFGTAYTLLAQYKKPTKDSKILVIGGGTAVSWYLIQLLKNHYDVGYVVSTNSPKSTPRVEALGVDKIIDYTKGDVAQQVVELVKQNDGDKFDLILDTVGGDSLFPVIDQILKPKTEGSGYATIVGDKILEYDAPSFKSLTSGFFFRLLFSKSFNYKHVTIIHIGEWYELAVQLFEQGKLKTLIDSTYTLDNYNDAIAKISGHKAEGKVVIKINE